MLFNPHIAFTHFSHFEYFIEYFLLAIKHL